MPRLTYARRSSIESLPNSTPCPLGDLDTGGEAILALLREGPPSSPELEGSLLLDLDLDRELLLSLELGERRREYGEGRDTSLPEDSDRERTRERDLESRRQDVDLERLVLERLVGEPSS